MSSSNLRPKKGKLRAAASSGSKAKTGQQSPSLRRKLDFPGASPKAAEVERPLKGKVFHLNAKRPQFAKRLKEDLEYLGGTVDQFLNRDVWYLITDNIEAKDTGKGSGKGTNQAGPASPAVSTPSPFHHTRGSFGNADSPSMMTAQESGPVTRGQAILQKAVKSQGGSSNVLSNARNLGIHIYHVDAIRKYLDREKVKLQQQLGPQTSKGHETPKDAKPSTSREKRLTRPFLKYEDSSRHYRPVTREFTSVPRVMADTARGSCPFDLHPQRKENKEQRAERNCDEGGGGDMGPPNSVKKASSVQKTPSNRAGHSSRKQAETTGVKEKRRGYCECCAVKYDDLEKHLKSNQHKEFVAKQNNYVNLDRMIAEGPNIDKFLEDVMKYHETDSQKAQTIQEELDEVILLSEPNPSTSKPPHVFAVPMSPVKSPSKQLKSRAKAAPSSPVQSPRSTNLSLRQRTSPRLLDGEPKSPDPPPSAAKEMEASSVYTFGKPSVSRIVPQRPPSSTESLCVGKKQRGQSRSRDTTQKSASQRSPKKVNDQTKVNEKQSETEQSKEHTGDGKASEMVDEGTKDDIDDREKQSTSRHKQPETATKKTKTDLVSDTDNQRTSKPEDAGINEQEKESSSGNSGSKFERKKRKVSQIPPDVLEDDVFEPDTRRFRTPGRKFGNFTKAGDSKKSRTPRTCASGSVEPDVENNELSSPRARPLRSCKDDNSGIIDESSRLKRKRKTEDVVGDASSKRQRTSDDVAEEETKRNLKTKAKSSEDGKEKGSSPTSLDDFKEESQVRRSSRGATKPNYAKQLLQTRKEKELARQTRTEKKQAIVNKLNNAQKQDDGNETSSERRGRRSNKKITVLRRQDIDKVIREKTTSLASNKNSSMSSTMVQPPSTAAEPITILEEEPRSEPNLPSMFRSDSSAMDLNFLGFRNDEIELTGENLLNLSATLDAGFEQKLERGALNVYCMPSSELELVEKTSESSDSVDLGDVSKVLQSLENFASEGSEWEAPINRYFDAFDEVVEDLKRRTSELQALTPRSHLAPGDDEEDSSLKENVIQKEAGNQQKLLLSSEGNIADGVADVPSTAAVDDTSTRRRSARIQDKDSVCGDGKESAPTAINAVPYVNPSGNAFDTQNNAGIFKAPFPSPKRKIGQSAGNLKFVTSTPVQQQSNVQPASPCISIPQGEDRELILENYVHDETEAEIVFPNFSSPDKAAGILMSPVKYMRLNNGEIGSPPVRRRRSNLSMSRDGFAYNISPSEKPEARKSLNFKLKRSPSLNIPKISSPGSHQLPSPVASSDFDTASNLNRSLSTPLSTSTVKSPVFYFNDCQNRKRLGSYTMNSKRPNFSNSILKPAKKGLSAKQLGKKHQQLKKVGGKKKVKSKGAKRAILHSDAGEDEDGDVYEFVDEGKGQSQSSTQESPPGPKKNMVSVSIQTNEEDLESDGTLRVRVPPSPVKQHLSPIKNRTPRKSETVMLASFNPVVNLDKDSVLPMSYWM
ncbi:uncharacterized protein [Amphiura filiformis]|uniref:uncharacterized protein n=1 Tax=Amphiura filiformis TaxID=82378 RepID=UPI003B20DBE7